MIAAMLRFLQPRRIRRTLPPVIGADIDSVEYRIGAVEEVT